MFHHAIKDLSDRLKPGSPFYDQVKVAMDGIIATIPLAANERRAILADHRISGIERKSQLEALENGELRQRIDRHLSSVHPIRDRIQEARKGRWNGYVDKNESEVLDNVGLVDSVAYFARRVLSGQ